MCFVCCVIYNISLTIVSHKASYELKWRYLKAILTKDAEWFDNQNVHKLPLDIYSNLDKAEHATGRTLGFVVFSLSACVTGMVAGFYIATYISMVNVIIIVFAAFVSGSESKATHETTQSQEKQYKLAGICASQSLGSIKVVKAFGQESQE